jgi:hypothetical protein
LSGNGLQKTSHCASHFKSSSLHKQIFIFDPPAAGLESHQETEVTLTIPYYTI